MEISDVRLRVMLTTEATPAASRWVLRPQMCPALRLSCSLVGNVTRAYAGPTVVCPSGVQGSERHRCCYVELKSREQRSSKLAEVI